MLKALGLTLDDARQYSQCSHSLSSFSMPHEGQFKGYGIEAYQLLYLLRYAIHGAFDEDFATVREWCEEKEIPPHVKHFDYEYENIKVKAFKNGRIDLKGITTEQTQKLAYLLDIQQKFKRTHVQRDHQY